MTPNPATMKFVANRLIIENGQTAEYLSQADTKGSSALAEQLFNFPFITSVFIAGNFVSLTKTDTIEFDNGDLYAFWTGDERRWTTPDTSTWTR